MTLWQSPSAQFPYLLLPELVHSEKVRENNTIRCSKTLQKIPVSADVISAWEAPVQNIDDPKELHDRLLILTSAFSDLIKKGQGLVNISEKEGPHDLVTEMDQGIEMLFRLWLNRHYPHHKIIGEEGHKAQINPDDIYWYIDPIDGTSNFIEGSPNIAIHFGSAYQGKPWVSILGLPFEKAHLSSYHGNTNPIPIPFKTPSSLIIGTEYLPNKKADFLILESLLQKTQAEQHRMKAIGIHIYELMQGNVSAFFKSRIKFWDFFAPLGVMQLLQPHDWNISLYIDQNTKINPFSNSLEFITHCNLKNTDNCRIGTIIVTPKHLPHLEKQILDEIITHGSKF